MYIFYIICVLSRQYPYQELTLSKANNVRNRVNCELNDYERSLNFYVDRINRSLYLGTTQLHLLELNVGF